MRPLLFILIISNSILYAQDVASIIENYLKVCGGRENLESLITSAKDFYFYNIYGNTDTTHIKAIEKRPAYRFTHVTGMKGDLQHETFLNLNKFVMAMYTPFPSVHSQDVQTSSNAFSHTQWIHIAQEIIFRQKKREFKKMGIDTLDGYNVYVLQSKNEDPKLKKTFFFDAASGLLVASKIEDLPNNLVRYSDYRSVKNILFPFLIETSMSNRPIAREVYNSIDINIPIEVETFDYKAVKIPSKRNLESRFNKVEWVQNAASINSLQQLTNHFKGKRLLIDIWATWCGPCKMEFTKYDDQFYSLLESKNTTILFLSTDKSEREDQWKRDVNFYNVNGYHMMATKNLVADIQKKIIKSETFYIPRYILINENGQILDGNLDRPSLPTFSDKIQSLLPNP